MGWSSIHCCLGDQFNHYCHPQVTLTHLSVHEPGPSKGRYQPQAKSRFPLLIGPMQSLPHIGKFLLELRLATPLCWSKSRSVLGQGCVILGMASLIPFFFPCCLQLFYRILANHFEHAVAWSTIYCHLHLYETGIDERSDGREPLINSAGSLSPTDGLCRFQCAAPHKYTQCPETALFWSSEQVVAPSNRFLHGTLALWQIAGSATQEPEPVRQALQQQGQGKRFDVCCRQLDSQWQSVHLVTNGCHRRRGIVQMRLHSPRSLAKEGHGGLSRQWRKRQFLFSPQVQWHPARDKYLLVRAAHQHLGHEDCRSQHLLAIVEEQQELFVLEEGTYLLGWGTISLFT